MRRREFLRRSAYGLLTAGLWPGALAAAGEEPDGPFDFVVLNDTHYRDERCAAYFEAAFAEIRARARYDFVLTAGDLATDGRPEELGPSRELLKLLGKPSYVAMGNHDHAGDSRQPWIDTFGSDSINFRFDHKGWTVLGLDSTNGTRSSGVVVPDETIAWIGRALRDIPTSRPLLCFTHFPFGDAVKYRLGNADEVLELFRDHNLKHIFSGHFHGLTERKAGDIGLTTNRCIAFSRGNHDGSKEKGYFQCHAENGQLRYEFVEFRYEA
jgi:3',5'-cyclic AMP phosphodiesterase CpdA